MNLRRHAMPMPPLASAARRRPRRHGAVYFQRALSWSRRTRRACQLTL
jgi:hypothetical protein